MSRRKARLKITAKRARDLRLDGETLEVHRVEIQGRENGESWLLSVYLDDAGKVQVSTIGDDLVPIESYRAGPDPKSRIGTTVYSWTQKLLRWGPRGVDKLRPEVQP